MRGEPVPPLQLLGGNPIGPWTGPSTMTSRTHAGAGRRAAFVPDPYVPGTATPATGVTALRPRPRLRLGSNRLDGPRADHGGRRGRPAPVQPRPGRAARRQGHASTGPRSPATRTSAGKLRAPAAGAADGRGRTFELDVRYAGAPARARSAWGEVGWEELTDGVLVAGQPNGAPTGSPATTTRATRRATASPSPPTPPYRSCANGELRRAPAALQPRRPGSTSSASRWPPTSRPCRSAATCCAATTRLGRRWPACRRPRRPQWIASIRRSRRRLRPWPTSRA